MTGFGAGEAPLGEGKVNLEARSVNHRFLEVRVNLAPELAAHASHVEQLARGRLQRGRYDISARLVGPALTTPALDTERARAAYQALRALRDELAPDSELPLTLLAAMPDLFRVPDEPSAEPARQALSDAFDRAVGALDAMRSREGEALAQDLRGHLGEAQKLCSTIAEHTPLLVAANRQRLRERLDRLLQDVSVELDSGRLEMEVALLADRADVSEELARLDSHLAQFERLLGSTSPVGRTLEFLLQEMVREANTIGSKAPDAQVAQRVVDLKATLERLREQVQNVE